jgi:hypothetical protein
MMVTAATPRKMAFNRDVGLLNPKSRMFDLRSHDINSTNAIPNIPELKVKRGAAKSAATTRSSTAAMPLWREMKAFALSRIERCGKGQKVFAKR